MAKNLDGVKKLNPEDIEKNRKIVLDFIGEKDSAGVNEQKKISQDAFSLRRVDGVNLNKINRFAAKEKETLKKSPARPAREPARDEQAERVEVSVEKEELTPQFVRRAREEERLKDTIKRQEEERKRIKGEEKQSWMRKEQAGKDRREREEKQNQEKTRLEKERIRREGIRQEETKQAEEAKRRKEKIKLEELEKEKQRRARENIQLEKMKREEEIKKIKQEMKIKKQAARGEKRIKRQKVWKKIKPNIIYIMSFLILFLAIIYMVFCLAVLRLKIDNNNIIISRVADYLPVPAVITSQGIISYSDFRKIENNDYLSLNLAGKKNYLARWLVLSGLKEKYGLPAGVADDDLAIRYVLDKDFNQVGLSRINKINESLKGQIGIEQLDKYADEYNDGAYYDAKSAVEEFGPTVLELAIGQTSKVITRADGYYILKRIDDKNGQLGLKDLFIKARTLDQYVSEKSESIKVFILAN